MPVDCASGFHDAPDAGAGVERLRPRGHGRLGQVLRAHARRQGGDGEEGAGARGDGDPRQGGRQVALPGVLRRAGAVEGVFKAEHTNPYQPPRETASSHQ